ncbi:hypothetical protein N0V82_008679 [Gnomoniopsis sp. IMI 355080]|nr:hypothetical protein N0V82_008679 [Gnomoniopsis sp. IMI 355080]
MAGDTSKPNVTMATKSNRQLHEYPTVLAYLLDLVEGSLPRSVHDAFRNEVELSYHLDAALLNAPPVRPLEFLHSTIPSDHKSFGTRKLWDNIGSILVYITGIEIGDGCVNQNGNPFSKRYPKTVVPDPRLDYGPKFCGKKGDESNNKKKRKRGEGEKERKRRDGQDSKLYACAGHHYDAEWSRCSLLSKGTITSDDGDTGDQASASQPTTSQPDASQVVAPPLAVGVEDGGLQPRGPQPCPQPCPQPGGLIPYGDPQAPHIPGTYPSYLTGTSQGTFLQAQTPIPQVQGWDTFFCPTQAPQMTQPAAVSWDIEQQQRGKLDDLARNMQLTQENNNNNHTTSFPPFSAGQTAQSAAAYQHVFSQPAPWQSSPTSQQQHGTNAYESPAAVPQNERKSYQKYDPKTKTFYN